MGRGDEQRTRELERLLDKYERRIFNLLHKLVGDRDDAADLTQETFLNAYRSLERFRREASEYTWLTKIAVNAAKNRFRARDRQRRVEVGVRDLPEAPHVESQAAVEGVPSAAVEARELAEVIDAALASLPEELRLAVVLRDVEGHSYKEIAGLTGASLENVKTRIFRGRARVRKMIEPYLRDEV